MSSWTPPRLIAHRGFSSRHPEQTRAAYAAAIAWSARTGIPVGLECDVHLSADGHLVCLHDATLDRTSNGRGPVARHTLAQLRALDFGSWRLAWPTVAERALVTLGELVAMTAGARASGVDVSLVIETKHVGRRDVGMEDAVAQLLHEQGWDEPGSPVQLISFSPEALDWAAALIPALPRTLLVETRRGDLRHGRLPDGASAVGLDVRLVRDDPGLVRRFLDRGHPVDVWTVNRPEDAAFLRDLGVRTITTDDLAAVADVAALVPAA